MQILPFSPLFRRIQSAVVLMLLFTASVSCGDFRQLLIGVFSEDYAAEGDPSDLRAEFAGPDQQRKQIRVTLTEVAGGMPMITDIQFPPGAHDAMFVACKNGALYVAVPGDASKKRLVHTFPVTTDSEQGLLGIAFHPEFRRNGLVYFNYTLDKKGKDISRISEFQFTNPEQPAAAKGKLGKERVIMEVEQPYQNHNAGQLLFGPDGMLYIGWGDGGWREDPKRHGQNPRTLLGAMLRIDPRTPAAPKQYGIPFDNPFADGKQAAPEIFATGVRNPWRFSFDTKGRLVVADVGQDKLEEISIVEAGGNYGWDVREASACHRPKKDCAQAAPDGTKFRGPVYEYGRDEGRSITGGYVYTGNRIAALRGHYVFGDFVTGRIWAIRLPDDPQKMIKQNESLSLGKWPLLISTFARDTRGEIYLGHFAEGIVYRLDPR